jgi:hypothetical protein
MANGDGSVGPGGDNSVASAATSVFRAAMSVASALRSLQRPATSARCRRRDRAMIDA